MGGGAHAKSFGPTIFPFCSSPLPVINDRSLMWWAARKYCLQATEAIVNRADPRLCRGGAKV